MMKKNREKGEIPFDDMSLGPFTYLHQVVIGNAYAWKEDYVRYRWESPDSVRHHKEAELAIRDRPEATEALWLIEPEPTDGVRQYAPFSETGLLGRFLSLKPELNEIKRFANRYGLLGHKKYLFNPSLKEQHLRYGESMTFWHDSINHMKMLKNLWQFVKKKDEQNLSEYIFWERGGKGVDRHVEFESELPYGGYRRGIIASEHIRPELLMRWVFGDLIGPATFFVHSEINKAMERHVSPAVLPFHQGQIFMVPDCLLSSLYVLFALEVSGRRNPDVKCKGCESYFQPLRADQIYHSEQCRKRHYWHNAKSSPKNRKKA